ncbi:MAG: hypothetical protein AAGC95_03350 [Pseudomonadota bacterium]
MSLLRRILRYFKDWDALATGIERLLAFGGGVGLLGGGVTVSMTSQSAFAVAGGFSAIGIGVGLTVFSLFRYVCVKLERTLFEYHPSNAAAVVYSLDRQRVRKNENGCLDVLGIQSVVANTRFGQITGLDLESLRGKLLLDFRRAFYDLVVAPDGQSKQEYLQELAKRCNHRIEKVWRGDLRRIRVRMTLNLMDVCGNRVPTKCSIYYSVYSLPILGERLVACVVPN